MNDPVSWLNEGSEKLILPRYEFDPAGQHDVDVVRVLGGMIWPLTTISFHFAAGSATRWVHPDRIDRGDVRRLALSAIG
jgi:hypothetical protein